MLAIPNNVEDEVEQLRTVNTRLIRELKEVNLELGKTDKDYTWAEIPRWDTWGSSDEMGTWNESWTSSDE